MKNWADHCSSDEESFEENVNEVHDFPVEDQHSDDEHGDDEVFPEEPKKEFDWPSQPPFTAYVGNLSYGIKEASVLADNLVKLAKEKLETDVNVLDSRLARQRGGGRDGGRDNDQPQRHRGFGYVEFETLEQLKAVVEGLGGAKIEGRPIQLDTANQSYVANRRSGNGKHREQMDGSKFRGGRYNNKDKDNNNRRRSETDAPATRTSLKLQPRSSKPAEEGASGGTSSTIFGGAKPRDEQSWRDRRKSENESGGDRRRNSKNNNNDNNNRRGSGRGGRGRRDGGRGQKHEEKANKAAPAATTQPPAEKPAPKKPAAPVNKFAALGFDSDSD